MDTEELKQLALAASPGPWALHRQPGERYTPTLTGAAHYDTDYIAVVANVEAINPDESDDAEEMVYRKGVVCDNAGYYAQPVMENDAAFIAAANPAVVLELLAEIERLKKRLPVGEDTAP